MGVAESQYTIDIIPACQGIDHTRILEHLELFYQTTASDNHQHVAFGCLDCSSNRLKISHIDWDVFDFDDIRDLVDLMLEIVGDLAGDRMEDAEVNPGLMREGDTLSLPLQQGELILCLPLPSNIGRCVYQSDVAHIKLKQQSVRGDW